MKKKLVFIIEQLTQGGAEVALLSLLNNLDYSKYDVDLFLVYHRGELFYMEKCDVYCKTSKYEGYGLNITEAKIKKTNTWN